MVRIVRARLGVLRKLWQIYAETVLPLEQKPAPDCEKPLQNSPEQSVAWGAIQGRFTSTFVPHPFRWKSSKHARRCGTGKEGTLPFCCCGSWFLEVLLLGQYSTGKTSMAPALCIAAVPSSDSEPNLRGEVADRVRKQLL